MASRYSLQRMPTLVTGLFTDGNNGDELSRARPATSASVSYRSSRRSEFSPRIYQRTSTPPPGFQRGAPLYRSSSPGPRDLIRNQRGSFRIAGSYIVGASPTTSSYSRTSRTSSLFRDDDMKPPGERPASPKLNWLEQMGSPSSTPRKPAPVVLKKPRISKRGIMLLENQAFHSKPRMPRTKSSPTKPGLMIRSLISPRHHKSPQVINREWAGSLRSGQSYSSTNQVVSEAIVTEEKKRPKRFEDEKRKRRINRHTRTRSVQSDNRYTVSSPTLSMKVRSSGSLPPKPYRKKTIDGPKLSPAEQKKLNSIDHYTLEIINHSKKTVKYFISEKSIKFLKKKGPMGWLRSRFGSVSLVLSICYSINVVNISQLCYVE